ncbi:hypothetical protein DPEC_G00266870 [Dallia pectoralis]|uniref:Uncharacterized protein n=1 Tax=Dallia pectoralis TaxID=75939 RepID=A0ACC2FNU5_DALPE|nr:hypothetical protein DPEC_G00266870 [Dallia pectoralis]
MENAEPFSSLCILRPSQQSGGDHGKFLLAGPGPFGQGRPDKLPGPAIRDTLGALPSPPFPGLKGSSPVCSSLIPSQWMSPSSGFTVGPGAELTPTAPPLPHVMHCLQMLAIY